jgi:molybdopterin converting factor small subunit
MRISVKLFAVAKQWAGADSVELELPAAATIGMVRQALLAQLPQLNQFGSNLRFAVGTDYANDATPISTASDVACIPPVSGG